MYDAMLAAGCAALGAVLVKGIDKLFYSPGDRVDDQAEFRRELREANKLLQEANKVLQADIDRASGEAVACRLTTLELVDYIFYLRSAVGESWLVMDELCVKAGMPRPVHAPMLPLPVEVVDGKIVPAVKPERSHT